MTECERFISEGKFPESFFNEETRCGYVVPTQMKKIWAVEMDLYMQFAKVCDKLGLRYFCGFGTILGAIRHNGFIPWDDDFDVCMPREDYEILCTKGIQEFSDPYFLQTPDSDPGYYFSFAKLRNSRTSSISMPFKNSSFNQGIAIDIFILDPSTAEDLEANRQAINECIMKCSSFMKRGSESDLTPRQLENFKKYQTASPLGELDIINELSTKVKQSSYLAIPTLTVYQTNRLIWPAECYAQAIDHSFENISIKIPIGYEIILRTTYGDYMEFPPLEKRGNWHTGVIWDPDTEYKNYLLPEGGWKSNV